MQPETDPDRAPAGADARFTTPIAAAPTHAIPASRRELHGLEEVTAAAGLLDLTETGGLPPVVPAPRAALPVWLRQAIAGATEDLARRPDPRPAVAAVAQRHGRPGGEVLLTAGADQAFALLAGALRPRRAAVVHPQLTVADAVLDTAGHSVQRVVLDERQGYRLDPAAIPDDADLVVLANPSDPAGSLCAAETLAGLARPGRLLVVDESLAGTVPTESTSLAGRRDLPGLLVLRGLPAVWPLAGLRAGYLLAPGHVVDELAAAQGRCPASAPALAALQACAAPSAVAEARAAADCLVADRAYLLDQLRQLPGIRVLGAPRTSVLLARVRDGRRLHARLAQKGRPAQLLAGVPGLGPDHVRIPVCDHTTSARLVAALDAALR